MAMVTAVGSFARRTTTGLDTVSGLSFQPKAVLLFLPMALAADTWTTGALWGLGMLAGVGTAPLSGANITQAAQTSFGGTTITSQIGQRIAAKAMVITTNTGTLTAEANGIITSDGFQLDWTTNAGTADILFWIALGGSDITNAFVKTFTSKATTGSHPVTGVGFQPDCLIFSGSQIAGASLPVGGDHGNVQLGIATAAASWAMGHYSQDGDTFSHTARAQDSGFVLLGVTATTVEPSVVSFVEKASLTSMDSDGFTLNYATATAAWWKMALCLKGGSYKVGLQAKTTGASGSADTVGSIGFDPVGALFASWEQVASTSAQNDRRLTWGVSDGTNERSGHNSDEDAQGTMHPRGFFRTTKAMVLNDADTAVVAAEADAALGTDQFTMTWSTNNAVAVEYGWLVVGNAGGGGPVAVPYRMLMGVGT
jgi:hypothetical protein